MAESDFTKKHCKPCEGGTKHMAEGEIREHLTKLEGWDYQDGAILRTFKFKDYYQTIAFVNAVSWIAHRENHHPILLITYNSCCVRYFTQAIKGISENDFICATQINALLSK